MITIVQEGPVFDKVKDVARKVNDTARNKVNNIKNTVDYVSGKRDSRFTYDSKASLTDLRKTALKTYANEASGWKLSKDPVNNMLRVQFPAKKVSRNLANRVDPNNKDRNSQSLSNYITGYDKSTDIVTMELPMDSGASAQKTAQKRLSKRNKSKSNKSNESVMTPTPTPYKGEVCDKDGKLIKKESLTLKTPLREGFIEAGDLEEGDYIDDFVTGEVVDVHFPDEITVTVRVKTESGDLETADFYPSDEVEVVNNPSSDYEESLTLKTESEDLLETPGLTLSVPEVVTDPKSGDSLVIKINGKEYRYVLPETSDKSVSDVARTVTGIQKHSEGRALAYLKKNMKLVTEAIDSDDDDEVQDEIVKSVIRDVNKKGLDINSEKYVNEIENSLKDKGISTDADYLGSMIVDVMNESKNPFKDNHICQGCGNPLSQCTCEVDTKEEDIDFDSLEEGTHHLGDEVTWDDSVYIIIDDSDSEEVVLRPKDKFKDSDFDSPELGDTSEDVYLNKYQLGECTQPSSIGQYKSDSIDLIDDEEEV